jgi:hypothetical protein
MVRHQVFIPADLVAQYPCARLFRRKEYFGWYLLPVQDGWVVINHETAHMDLVREPRLTKEQVEDVIFSTVLDLTNRDIVVGTYMGLDERYTSWHVYKKLPVHVAQRYKEVKKAISKAGDTNRAWEAIDELNYTYIDVIGYKIVPEEALEGILNELAVNNMREPPWWRRLFFWR